MLVWIREVDESVAPRRGNPRAERAELQKFEYVSGLCAAHGVEVWALTTRRE